MENFDLREASAVSAERLKAGKIISLPTAAGNILAADFRNSASIEILSQIKAQADCELILLTDGTEKFNFILQDVPPLAYDIIEQSEEKMPVVVFDKPLAGLHKALLKENNLPVLILPDALIKNICNRGVKVLAALIFNDESHQGFLDKVDYIVTLPRAENPRPYKPSWISLKMNGEVKIIRK
jgi:hypothetical protein